MKPSRWVKGDPPEGSPWTGVPVSRLEPTDPSVANLIVLAATELTTDADIAALCAALAEELA